MQRAIWQEDSKEIKAPVQPAPKVRAPWDDVSLTNSEILNENERIEQMKSYKFKTPWDEQSIDKINAFDKELAALDYQIAPPWHETSTDKLNYTAEAEQRKALYNYQALWAEPEITEARKQQLANYKLDTPFSVENQELKPGEGEKSRKKSSLPPTIPPWQHGGLPGDPPRTSLAPKVSTGLWAVEEVNKPIDTEIELSGDPILDNLRMQLKKRGANGILGLARLFKIMDDNNSGSLDMNEFVKAMKESKVSDISERAIKHLFRYFDIDDSGSITYDEFLVGIRGVMNARRQGMVDLAFDIIDKDGSGELDINDIKDVYNAKGHPDVIAGKKAEEEVLLEFLSHMVVNSHKQATKVTKVTKKDFNYYYSNISSSIDSDDYFELMMRNAWHISGGEGWCANTTNRRVLVTHADGRQTVEEVKNDMGLNPKDKKGLVERLRQLGVDAAKIDAVGGVDDHHDYNENINNNTKNLDIKLKPSASIDHKPTLVPPASNNILLMAAGAVPNLANKGSGSGTNTPKGLNQTMNQAINQTKVQSLNQVLNQTVNIPINQTQNQQVVSGRNLTNAGSGTIAPQGQGVNLGTLLKNIK